ncbi:hypothetical protein TcWFU_008888 [Taenia crassiceps]|uniref:H(+)-exporting diphosphatase n=1 Tax=Taenia crassiceps TaxID=6207 RepID=A0ABR4QBS2_9CEST
MFVRVCPTLYIGLDKADRIGAMQTNAVGNTYALVVGEFAGEAGKMGFEAVADGVGGGFEALHLSPIVSTTSVMPTFVSFLLQLLAFVACRDVCEGEEVHCSTQMDGVAVWSLESRTTMAV